MIETKQSGTYSKIENVNEIPAFFINVVSSSDVWMFLSSRGTPSAGRQNAEGSIFPYETDDRMHLSTSTGPKTIVRFENGKIWEPFNFGFDNPYKIKRNLYKRVTGDAVIFEEINECLNLEFSYRWETSEKYGIIRTAEIRNFGNESCKVEILDGLENIMAHGIPSGLQQSLSCLTDAYKAGERPDGGKLAVYSITAGIGDTLEPVEILRANVVWFIGEADKYLLSSKQVSDFASGAEIENEERTAGRKSAFIICKSLELAAGGKNSWVFVLDTRKTQRDVIKMLNEVNSKSNDELLKNVTDDIKKGTDELERIVASADGLQETGDSRGVVRHYMNVLYNNMRGGVFLDGYDFDVKLFEKFLNSRNKDLVSRQSGFMEKIKNVTNILELHTLAYENGDKDLIRLSLEFLPLTFSRRHGDPSRPWNWFNIRVKDDDGNRIYYYEGNWRDIFQNWEAMGLSFPGFIAPMIAKFLNATTIDGFNPYRITSDGIDWETPAPHDPWAGIGYWGDHQIVYSNKLLEWLEMYAPEMINKLFENDIFTYANVPYEFQKYDSLVKDGKNTIYFNFDKHNKVEETVKTFGADGRLVMENGKPYHVSFIEKLLVPVLSKLSNLVIGGGIWMNTQRPEWNDANNAIVGNGLSMVTVYQLYRHVNFIKKLVFNLNGTHSISKEVNVWFNEIGQALKKRGDYTPRSFLDKVGASFSSYRFSIYENGFSGKEDLQCENVLTFCEAAIETLAETIKMNKRDDGMYHSYNILTLTKDSLKVSNMFLMLEGQTAVLGSGLLGMEEAISLAEAMEASDLMNKKIGQFYLYPVKNIKTFVDKNIIPAEMFDKSELLKSLINKNHEGFIFIDANKKIRFHENVSQTPDIEKWLDIFAADKDYKALAEKEADFIREIYEAVFKHKEFTGRSGIMYKYEGIGCIYWHQNSKFMLSMQEVFTNAILNGSNDFGKLKETYYRLQEGFGFRKDAADWGAFPLEPYSHQSFDNLAQQPGMTGQVKEDILTRYAELGLVVKDGVISFNPALLRSEEFTKKTGVFKYFDVSGNKAKVGMPKESLAFTICQVPVVYILRNNTRKLPISYSPCQSNPVLEQVLFDELNKQTAESSGDSCFAGSAVYVDVDDETIVSDSLSLDKQTCASIFNRDGKVKKIVVIFSS